MRKKGELILSLLFGFCFSAQQTQYLESMHSMVWGLIYDRCHRLCVYVSVCTVHVGCELHYNCPSKSKSKSPIQWNNLFLSISARWYHIAEQCFRFIAGNIECEWIRCVFSHRSPLSLEYLTRFLCLSDTWLMITVDNGFVFIILGGWFLFRIHYNLPFTNE